MLFDKGIQCDRVNEIPVPAAKQQPAAGDVSPDTTTDVVDDIQDLANEDATEEDVCTFEVIEEEPEPDYHDTWQDNNYQPNTDSDTGTETDTDNEESTSAKHPRYNK